MLSKGEGTIRIVKMGVGIVQNGGDLLGQRIEQIRSVVRRFGKAKISLE